jgi:DNA-binding MarR family transcriptional regulator
MTKPDPIAPQMQRWFAASVRRDGPDLSARQMAVLLTVYAVHGPAPWTVRGLASELSISKPAITRALDRLSSLYLIERMIDPNDRRSVDILRTATGHNLLKQLEQDWRQALTALQAEAEHA